MGELAFDTDVARSIADDVGTAARQADEVAGLLETALRSIDLPTGPVVLTREVADECRTLGRYLTAMVDCVEVADRFGGRLDQESWARAMRSGRRSAEAQLWAGLRDDVGADALSAGAFTLGSSMVSIERHEWARATIPPGCRSFGPDRYYTGGGAVRGPDGRRYPIVVPHVVDGEDHWTIDGDGGVPDGVPSVATLDGSDPGWRIVGYRTGIEQFHDDIGTAAQVMMAVAHGTGLPAPAHIADEHLPHIVLGPGLRPVFEGDPPPSPNASADPATAGQSLDPHTGAVVAVRVPGERAGSKRPTASAIPNPPVPPSVASRANLPANTASLAIGGLHGVGVALSANDANHRAVEVVFEEHPDGRLRSRVQSFALEPRSGGVLLTAWHLFVDDDGHLRQSPAKYRADPTRDDRDDERVVADNVLAPEYAPRVPRSAITPA